MKRFFIFVLILFSIISCPNIILNKNAFALNSSNKKYFTVYENSVKGKVIFTKGENVFVGDTYLSSENNLYKIEKVDEKNKIAICKFIKKETLPEYEIKKTTKKKTIKTFSKSKKIIGLYHTHNDESYFTPDGYDSVYGKGGIHDVAKSLSKNLNGLDIQTIYDEALHLPHNSGAYTRSEVTASSILNKGADAIFDIHRDSTKRSEYLTKVDGKTMSAIRMVVGSSSKNFEENKKFAYSIKSYADKVYPGLVKDVYFGRGNYNQHLSNRAMLFEFGSENIEKKLVLNSTPYLAKVLDVVLYGSDNASKKSLNDVETINKNSKISGISKSASKNINSNQTLFIVLGTLGGIGIIFSLVMIFSKRARYKVGRFFSELFAGIFGRKKV